MSDPAIEAAQRAWVEKAPWDEDVASGAVRPPVGFVAAAREALAPIRERHKPVETIVRRAANGYKPEIVRSCGYCDDGFESWPCADAKDIYPSEEL